MPHPARYAGTPAEQKIAELQATLRKAGEDWAMLTMPDSIAWLLNIRGSDVAHNPVPLAFALVPASGKPELYIDPAKIGPEARAHLAKLVKLVPDDKTARARRAAMKPEAQAKAAIAAEKAVRKALGARLADIKKAGKRVRLDPGTAAMWFFRKLGPQEHRAAAPIPACCRRRRRTPPRSRARASPTSATERRWRASSPGSTARRPRAGSTRSSARSRWRRSAARPRR